MADRNRLSLLATAFDDDIEVKFVGKRDGQERCEDAILELDGRKVFLEGAAVDGNLTGAFGHPDAGYGGFAAAGGALSGGGGHLEKKMGLFDSVGDGSLRFVWVGLTGIDLELAELGATEAGLRDHPPDGALDEQDRTALADNAWSLDLLATDVAGEAGVDLGSFLGAGKDALVGIDDDDEISGVNVAGENGLVLAAEEACGLNGDLAEDLALGIDHIPLALDFVRLGGKRLHVLVVEKWLRTHGVGEGVGKLGSSFLGVNREIVGKFLVFLSSLGWVTHHPSGAG